MILVLSVVLLIPIAASSFALRNMDKGDKVPDLEFKGIAGEGGRLSSFAGEKGLIVIYWATWSSRSPDALRFAEESLRRYEKLGFRLLAVNADHQEMKAEDVAAVKAMAAELKISFPVVLDVDLKGYNLLGIITTPTTLILDKDLKLVDAYPGFPSVARDDIPDRIDAFLGIVKEKREEKAQYFLDHKPKNYALQYYNLGKRLFMSARSPSGQLKRVPEDAVERLDEAIRRDPEFFRPYVLKAIILHLAKSNGHKEAALAALSKRDFQEPYERRVLGFGYLYMGMDNTAGDYFQLLSGVAPDDAAVLFGQAVTAVRKNDAAGVKKALAALAKNPKAPEELGVEPAALFTANGELKPGAESGIRAALERFLEIERSGEGALRTDAPAMGAPKP